MEDTCGNPIYQSRLRKEMMKDMDTFDFCVRRTFADSLARHKETSPGDPPSVKLR